MTATETRIDFTHPSLAADSDWRARAACVGEHPDANWFPDQHHAHDAATKEAYRICREECPVRLHCLRMAMLVDRNRDRGIFGGLSPRERSRLRARLVEAGLLPVVRVCANPSCRAEFVAKPTTMRGNVCCSNACRAARRRLLARSSRLNRTQAS